MCASAARSATDLVRMTAAACSAWASSRGWDAATRGGRDSKSSDLAGDSRISTSRSLPSDLEADP